jgi:signal transduction histidine kinase
MVLGGLLGSVLMLTIHFGFATNRTSRELQRARDQLEQRVKARTRELEQVNRRLRNEVTDRKRAEDSYRGLSGRLLRLQDEERRRIARELHDSTAQMLGALAINVDRVRTSVRASDLDRAEHLLSESGEFVEEVTQEIRTVSYLLHPPMLDDLGLEYVLPWYAAGFGERSGIVTTLDVQPDLGRLPCEVELTLFRIVQEALANVHRHSGSPSVAIALSRDARDVTLEIRDRGKGVPQSVVDTVMGATEASAPIGVGIAGMRERVRQLQGEMEISGTEAGTTIRAVLPVSEATGARTPAATIPCDVCGGLEGSRLRVIGARATDPAARCGVPESSLRTPPQRVA